MLTGLSLDIASCNSVTSDLTIGAPAPLSIALWLHAMFKKTTHGTGSTSADPTFFWYGFSNLSLDEYPIRAANKSVIYRGSKIVSGKFMDESRIKSCRLSVVFEHEVNAFKITDFNNVVSSNPFLGGSAMIIKSVQELDWNNKLIQLFSPCKMVVNASGLISSDIDNATDDKCAFLIRLTKREKVFPALVGYSLLESPSARRGVRYSPETGVCQHAYVSSLHGLVRYAPFKLAEKDRYKWEMERGDPKNPGDVVFLTK